MEKDFLKVEDLFVEYTSEGSTVHAVNGMSVSLEKGKTLGVVGETGAGKTTLAKSIMRILPDVGAFIRGGKISLEGQDLLELKEEEMIKIRGRKISMIFQDPMTALNPTMTVGKQIAEVIEAHNNFSKEETRKRAESMLEMVGIPAERYDEYPHQFSGGMKQRIVIAIALACDPELLIADESTTALDVTIQAQVLDMIRGLRDQFQTSLIMITHDLGIIAEMSDYVAVTYAGQFIEYGSLEQIYDHPTHPYTVGLFGSIPHLHEDVRRLTPVEGLMPDPTNLPQGCKFNPRCKFACERCRQEKPQMVDIGGGHLCRCLRVHELEELRNGID
ncbi:MAG: ABC transporter ATP-binding protein [Oscillospiraceae bacterium]|nr:ABC transporter ATP-binding protein [Oscillospiraceae bacterium]